MDKKFLSDGRKVAVIGQLNNTETIVQEVFVTEAGDELPSGERFVVKSLHDVPVKSYKDKELEKKEAQLARVKSDIDQASREQKRINAQLKGMKELLKQSKLSVDCFNNNELERLKAFISGSIEYVCKVGYRVEEPIIFSEAVTCYERDWGEIRFDGIKLLSVLGSSNGDLSYRMNQYRDGSGSWVEIVPFTSFGEAIAFTKSLAEERIEADKFSLDEFKTCSGMGITFSPEHMDKLFQKFIGSLDQSSEKLRADLEKRIEDIGQQRQEMTTLLQPETA